MDFKIELKKSDFVIRFEKHFQSLGSLMNQGAKNVVKIMGERAKELAKSYIGAPGEGNKEPIQYLDKPWKRPLGAIAKDKRIKEGGNTNFKQLLSRHGLLHASIKLSRARLLKGLGATIELLASRTSNKGFDVAKAQEEGNGMTPARPYLDPSLRQVEDEVNREGSMLHQKIIAEIERLLKVR